MNARQVSAPKICKAARREELPRIGEERDGGFVVSVREDALEYSVRRFVKDVPPRLLRAPGSPPVGFGDGAGQLS